MKKYTLLFIALFFINTIQGQDKGSIYVGLYSWGTGEFYSKYVTPPLYRDLRYYTISLFPKLGYRYRSVTLGLIGSYTFHKNTFETLEPSLGYGYFIKYNYLKKNIPLAKKISAQFFAEWLHTIQDGYYVGLPTDWHRIKVHSPTTYYSALGGLDISLPKSFSISLGVGVTAYNLLIDPTNPQSAKPFKYTFGSAITLQYNLKL